MLDTPIIKPKNELWFFHKRASEYIKASHDIADAPNAPAIMAPITPYYISISANGVKSNYPHLSQHDKAQDTVHDIAVHYLQKKCAYTCHIEPNSHTQIHIIIAPFIDNKQAQDVLAQLNIMVGEQANATIMLTQYGSTDDSFVFLHNNITVQAGATLCLMRYNMDSSTQDKARQYHVIEANLYKNAKMEQYNMVRFGAFNRHETHIHLLQAGTQYKAYSLTHANQGVHDMVYQAYHHHSDTYSAMHNRALLDGTAHGIFMAKSTIDVGATNSETHQQSKAYLLSNDAKMDAKPELDIRHDQVIATHGSAVGELDDMQLFYLMARGINRQDAMQLLAHGLLSEILQETVNEKADDMYFNHWLQANNL